MNFSIPAAIDHFIVRCLHVLGYTIGSAIVDTLLPLTIGIVAIGVIGFVVYERLNARRPAHRSYSGAAGRPAKRRSS
jgi:hypothetical protein